jgi:hypothetical protein
MYLVVNGDDAEKLQVLEDSYKSVKRLEPKITTICLLFSIITRAPDCNISPSCQAERFIALDESDAHLIGKRPCSWLHGDSLSESEDNLVCSDLNLVVGFAKFVYVAALVAHLGLIFEVKLGERVRSAVGAAGTSHESATNGC